MMPAVVIADMQADEQTKMQAVVIADMQADEQTKMQAVVTADMLADDQTASLIPSRDESILSNYWKNLFFVSNCKKTVYLLSFEIYCIAKRFTR